MMMHSGYDPYDFRNSALYKFQQEQDAKVYEAEMYRLTALARKAEQRERELRQMPIVPDGVHPAVDRARRDFDRGNGLMGTVRRWLAR